MAIRSLASTALLLSTLAASPAPTKDEVMNFRFNEHEMGCATRALQAAEKDHSVKFLADPHGKYHIGMKVQINRDDFQETLSNMTSASRACLEQALYLLTPDSE